MTFPDWDRNPTAEGDKLHVLVQCLLDPLPDPPRVHDRDASLVQMPSMTVACCSHTGVYSPANFMRCLKKIQDHLKAQGIPAVGPPRYLYYSDTTLDALVVAREPKCRCRFPPVRGRIKAFTEKRPLF